jgi:biuret amidohydrolase
MSTIDVSSTALLIVHMQRDFCAPHGYAARAGMTVERMRRPIANIAALLAAARGAGMMVVHARQGYRRDLSDCSPQKLAQSLRAGARVGSTGPMGQVLVRGEYGQDSIDELAPAAGESVIDHPGYSAFHASDLDVQLRRSRIRNLLLTGVSTEVSVQSTLRQAIDHGYTCVTVRDACASAHPDLHQATLAMIEVQAGVFGEIDGATNIVFGIETARSRPRAA